MRTLSRKTALVGALLLAMLTLGRRGDATPVTVYFSGTDDLTVFGASPTSSYSGSVTWDTGTSPLFASATLADYLIESATFSINSTDFTSSVQTGNSRVSVCNGCTGLVADAFDIDLRFAPLLNVGLGPDIFRFQLGVADDGGNMFSGVSLPTDTAFLTSANRTFANFQSVGGFDEVSSPADNSPVVTGVAPVPEPATLLLVGTGGVAAGLRRRKRNLG